MAMARPLRIEVAGGWYHVTARGNQRQRLYTDRKDRIDFLELLEGLAERVGRLDYVSVAGAIRRFCARA